MFPIMESLRPRSAAQGHVGVDDQIFETFPRG